MPSNDDMFDNEDKMFEREAMRDHLKDLGITETIKRENGITEIKWENTRAITAEAKLAEVEQATKDVYTDYQDAVQRLKTTKIELATVDEQLTGLKLAKYQTRADKIKKLCSMAIACESLAERVVKLEAENAKLREALEFLGEKRQFDTLCWCDTEDGTYCVGQPQCKKSLAALTAPAESEPKGKL